MRLVAVGYMLAVLCFVAGVAWWLTDWRDNWPAIVLGLLAAIVVWAGTMVCTIIRLDRGTI